jgi:predicted dehydrogenase
MRRIGIIGSDSSHAVAFSKLINVDGAVGDRARVVTLWGLDPERNQEVARAGQIPAIAGSLEELAGEIDLAIVTSRRGDVHLHQSLPVIERGIPTYVGKPIAIAYDEIDRIFEAADASGAAISSFSPLRYAPSLDALAADVAGIGKIEVAHITGPCDFESEYGGPFFYATHVIEAAFRLIGEDIAAVRARRYGDNVLVQATWSSGPVATFSYLKAASYHFHATLIGSEGMASGEILGGDETYAETLNQIVTMGETGVRPLTKEQIVRPIQVVYAIQASLDNDGAEFAVR